MKKVIYTIFVLVFIHCTLNIENCMCQWVIDSIGMGDKKVNSLATSGNNIFAGTGDYLSSDVLYRSTNNGNTWLQTTLNKVVVSLAISGNNIFAGTWGNGVYLSTNNGNSWTQTSLNTGEIISLTINSNYIFAGTAYDSGVYRSANNGVNWIKVNSGLANPSIQSLVVSGTNLFAGTSNGIYLSSNNGNNWAHTGFYQSVLSFAFNGSNIFAGTNMNGVYLSTNNGSTWIQIGVNGNRIISFATRINNIFAGSNLNGVYLSTNNGVNWVQKNEGFTFGTDILSLLIFNNYIFAGTNKSVWRRPLSDLGIGIKNISTEVPSSFALSQNYPNPFNPSTNVQFSIPNAQFVTLKVFDMLGKEIATLVSEKLKAGTYETTFDGSNLPSGVYFYKLETENFSDVKKMILIK